MILKRRKCKGALGMLTLPAGGFNLNFLVATVMSLTEWPPMACLFFFFWIVVVIVFVVVAASLLCQYFCVAAELAVSNVV